MSTNTADHEYNARKIHQSLGGTTAFFRGYTIGELMLFLAVAFVTVVAATFVPAALTIPILGFGIMLTTLLFLLHKVKPQSITSRGSRSPPVGTESTSVMSG